MRRAAGFILASTAIARLLCSPLLRPANAIDWSSAVRLLEFGVLEESTALDDQVVGVVAPAAIVIVRASHQQLESMKLDFGELTDGYQLTVNELAVNYPGRCATAAQDRDQPEVCWMQNLPPAASGSNVDPADRVSAIDFIESVICPRSGSTRK